VTSASLGCNSATLLSEGAHRVALLVPFDVQYRNDVHCRGLSRDEQALLCQLLRVLQCGESAKARSLSSTTSAERNWLSPTQTRR